MNLPEKKLRSVQSERRQREENSNRNRCREIEPRAVKSLNCLHQWWIECRCCATVNAFKREKINWVTSWTFIILYEKVKNKFIELFLLLQQNCIFELLSTIKIRRVSQCNLKFIMGMLKFEHHNLISANFKQFTWNVKCDLRSYNRPISSEIETVDECDSFAPARWICKSNIT